MNPESGFRYGVCTWIFADTPLEEIASRLADIGYDGVELLGDLARYKPDQVRRCLERHGLSVLSLTPENVDLAHPDEGLRTAAVNYYLDLAEFAANVGSPVMSCHGAVGRIRAAATQKQEEDHLLDGVKRIVETSGALGVRVAMEVLNRYESHLLNTASEARRFVEQVGSDRVGILLDTYHMNIEEADPVAALWTAGPRLCLFHAADSNRRAVGRGHVPFPSLLCALKQMGYSGPVVVETPAPGPDPFTPVKGSGFAESAFSEAAHSLESLRRLAARACEALPCLP